MIPLVLQYYITNFPQGIYPADTAYIKWFKRLQHPSDKHINATISFILTRSSFPCTMIPVFAYIRGLWHGEVGASQCFLILLFGLSETLGGSLSSLSLHSRLERQICGTCRRSRWRTRAVHRLNRPCRCWRDLRRVGRNCAQLRT